MKHKTSELTGALLDAAVALADGMTPGKFGTRNFYVEELDDGTTVCTSDPKQECQSRYICVESGADSGAWLYNPSVDFAIGGPIIERDRIRLQPPRGIYYWEADTLDSKKVQHWGRGETALIAAMRAFVASRLGEDVEIP